jgi:hypothetical protein
MANQEETTPILARPDEVALYLSERFAALGHSVDKATDAAAKRKFRRERDVVACGLQLYWLGAMLNGLIQLSLPREEPT